MTHVVISGGGIGGLCLAQGLKGAGVPVTVLERDVEPASRWEGYRIHIDPAGARSLRACLPGPLWEAFLAVAAPGGDFGFVNAQLEELLVVEEEISHPRAADPGESHYAVDRRALRRLLGAGLGDALRFGAEFSHYEAGDDGVVAHLADGSTVTGDLLVGADGVGSRVRRQYLPHAEPVPAGAAGLAAKLTLTDATRAWVPPRLLQGMNLVLGGGPAAMFAAVYEPPAGARAALAAAVGAPAADLPPIDEPYLLLSLVADPTTLPVNVTTLDDDGLGELVATLTEDWHPMLRRLFAEADPGSRGGRGFVVSPVHPAWPASRVTVLGDAIHAVPATGGLGGNTALRDARRLVQALTTDGHDDLVSAVAAYEEDLRDHGHAAIRDALATRDRMIAGRAASTGGRAFFWLCGRVTPLRRRIFGDNERTLSRPRSWEEPADARPGQVAK